VDISGFWLKKTEVTWDEWNKVRAHAEAQEYFDLAEGRNGYQGSVDGSHPVTGITWWDAVKWCNLKSQVENRQPVYHTNKNFDGAAVFKMGNQEPIVNWEANGYRLPTEAEWEYACREGKNTDSYPYYGKLDSIAWYAANSGGNTHPVGKKTEVSHKFGLHDMHGNVSEWCWDYVGLLLPGKYDDPRGPSSGSFRVFRGGSWADPARSCRSAYRGSFSPAAPESCLVGFRPVCSGNPAEIPKP
jgi:formylglycine-generating enzyme required for sulfatase activity